MPRYQDEHAILSPSNGAWLRYSDDKLRIVVANKQKSVLGTKLHETAKECISMGVRLAGDETLALYVNDCIDAGMFPEEYLRYSEYCYGTADAISFDGMTLRIYDLKTGTSKVSGDQLLSYAAIFCLQYGVNPLSIEYDLRIYQHDDYFIFDVNGGDVAEAADLIVHKSNIVAEMFQGLTFKERMAAYACETNCF